MSKPDNGPRDHALELELLHQYSTATWKSFCHSHRQGEEAERQEQAFLQIIAPQQGLKHDFARDAIFAIAALHLASLTQQASNRKRYLHATLQYQCSAQTGFAKAMKTISNEHGPVLFTTSLAFFVLSVAVPRYFDQSSDPSGDSLGNILMAYRLFRGSIKILQEQSHCSAELSRIWQPKDMSLFEQCTPDIKYAIDRLRHILNQSYHITIGAPADQPGCDLVDGLEYAFRRNQAGNMTSAFGWLLSMPEEYVDDLLKGERTASFIFLHWCVLLNYSSQLWWIPRSSRAIALRLKQSLIKPECELSINETLALAWCSEQLDLQQ